MRKATKVSVTIIPGIRYKGKIYTFERYSSNKKVIEKLGKKFRSLDYKAIIKNLTLGKKTYYAIYIRRPESFKKTK